MIDGLRRVQVQGFCSLADVSFEPGRLTVLIGANGSGKSNVLRALKPAPLLRTYLFTVVSLRVTADALG